MECEKNGKTMLASVVDHIVPHRGNTTIFWDRTNWQSLCRRCHNRKTATQDSRFAQHNSR
ncbi:MAG: HNH endonuclease [Gammaproteobacteria bacterium]